MSSDSQSTYVIGVDYGTLSGRAVVVRGADGAEFGSAVYEYPHAVLADALPDGTGLGHDWALQVPGDYVDVLRRAVPAAVAAVGIDPAAVVGIGTDFTACTAEAMGRVGRAVYTPDEAAAAIYDELFAEYTKLHDYFGRGGNKVMRTLRAVKRRAVVGS
jgi:ribulose kinase